MFLLLVALVHSAQWIDAPLGGNPPTRRRGEAICYDTLNDQLLIAGGRSPAPGSTLRDLYSVDLSGGKGEPGVPAVFTRLPQLAAGPQGTPTLFNHRAVWLAEGKRMLTFGGEHDDGMHADVWGFDPATFTWTQEWSEAATGASARVDCGVAVISGPERVLLFGGLGVTGRMRDAWIYEPSTTTWTQLNVTGTVPPLISGVTMHPTTSETASMGDAVLFGGKATIGGVEVEQNSVYLLDVTSQPGAVIFTLLNTTGTPPTPRFLHTSVMWKDILWVAFGWSTTAHSSNPDFAFLNMTNAAWQPFNGTGLILRDSTYAVLQPSAERVIVFGGWALQPYGLLNELLILDPAIASTAYGWWHNSPNMDLPEARAEHAAALVGHEMFIFGGDSGDDSLGLLQDMWRLDVYTWEWSIVVSTSASPEPRYGHQMHAVGSSLVMFGGQTASGDKMRDVWRFNIQANLWEELEPTGDLPLARLGHRGVIPGGREIWYYGGEGATTVLGPEGWIVLDTKELKWRVVPATGPGSLAFFAIAYVPSSNRIVIHGGRNQGYSEINNVWVYEMESGTFWETLTDTQGDGTSHHTAQVTGDRTIIFGGEAYGLLRDVFAGFRVGDSVATPINGTASLLPLHGGLRGGHSMLFAGTSLIMWGGYGATGGSSQKLVGFTLNSLLHLDGGPCSLAASSAAGAGDSSCWPCAVGWKYSTGTCESCPIGQYGASIDVCADCPAGFYGTLEAANGPETCPPCEQGTSQADPGQSSCEACPKPELCPLASIYPQPAVKADGDGVDTIQPQHHILDNAQISTNENIVLIIAGSVILILAIVYCVLPKRMKQSKLTPIDNMFVVQPKEPGGPLFKRRTTMGGIFTILFLVVLVFFTLQLIVPLLTDNWSESQALLPILAVPGGSESFESDFAVRVTLATYGGVCTAGKSKCSPGISMTADGMDGSDDSTMTCSWDDANCVVDWKCKGCSLAIPEVDLTFSTVEDNAFAAAVEWVLNSSSSLPQGLEERLPANAGNSLIEHEQQASGLSSVFIPTAGHSFRGGEPSLVSVLAVPTVFSVPQVSSNTTGYHLAYVRSSTGQEVDGSSFHFTNGLSMRFQFTRDETAFTVTLNIERDPLTLFATVLGAASGLLGLVKRIFSVAFKVKTHPKSKLCWSKHKARKESRLEKKRRGETTTSSSVWGAPSEDNIYLSEVVTTNPEDGRDERGN